MAELEVTLDGFAQVVSAHAGHHDVGDYQIRNLVLHALQRGSGVEIDRHIVVRTQQDFHVVGDVDVVVHHRNPLAVLALGSLDRHFRGRRGRDVVHRLYLGPFVFGIGRCVHGQDEGEDGAAFGPVAGLDIAVMQARQGAGIVQADA